MDSIVNLNDAFGFIVNPKKAKHFNVFVMVTRRMLGMTCSDLDATVFQYILVKMISIHGRILM